MSALDCRRRRIDADWNALGRKLNEYRLGVPHAARLQAGQPIGDQLGQHRQHAVRQIDARAALHRFAIERGARPHEVRDVGYVNAQSPMTPFQLDEADGIVKVTRVDRVDRDDHFARQILARGRNALVETAGFQPGFVQRVGGKLLGQVEFADDRDRVDAGRAARAEHFGHYALAVLIVRGKADHLDDNLVVGPCILRARIADHDGPRKRPAVDLHQRGAGAAGNSRDSTRHRPARFRHPCLSAGDDSPLRLCPTGKGPRGA